MKRYGWLNPTMAACSLQVAYGVFLRRTVLPPGAGSGPGTLLERGLLDIRRMPRPTSHASRKHFAWCRAAECINTARMWCLGRECAWPACVVKHESAEQRRTAEQPPISVAAAPPQLLLACCQHARDSAQNIPQYTRRPIMDGVSWPPPPPPPNGSAARMANAGDAVSQHISLS